MCGRLNFGPRPCQTHPTRAAPASKPIISAPIIANTARRTRPTSAIDVSLRREGDAQSSQKAGSFAPATGRRPARISSPLSSHSHSGPAFWQRTTKPCCRPTTEGRGSLAPLQNRHDVDAADIAGHQRVISLDREPLMVRDRKPGLRQHVRLAHVILRRRGKQSAAPGPSADFRGVDRHRFRDSHSAARSS